jgi:putative ABC transport system substrate-binding protein
MARAQQSAIPVVGYLSGQSPAETAAYVLAFRQGLNETGYVEHRNVGIEYRWARGRYDRLAAFAADLVRLPVSVIAAVGNVASLLAAKAATATIPIVFTTGSYPVKVGLVTSFNRPGGNATGVSFLANDLARKRLELLHELVPTATAIGLLVNPTNPDAQLETSEAQAAARVLGIRLQIENASSSIDAAFASFVQQQVKALFVAADAYFTARRDQVVALAARHALPASYAVRDSVAAGGLMSYGTP